VTHWQVATNNSLLATIHLQNAVIAALFSSVYPVK